jgi:hypothetical protein
MVRVEKISRSDSMRNDKVLHRVKEERYILQENKKTKDKPIGHILHRNFIQKHFIEQKTKLRIYVN